MEEYKVITDFMKQLGVEVRMTLWDAVTDTVTIQARNNYKNWAEAYRNTQITGGHIEKLAQDEIKSGHWRR
jgi:hypothetical protein